jgi:hypothetical protein
MVEFFCGVFLAFFFDRAGDEGGVSFEENDEHFSGRKGGGDSEGLYLMIWGSKSGDLGRAPSES